MALNWLWSERCGEATIKRTVGEETREYTLGLYQGNAFLIFLNEYEENGEKMWNMYSFFLDETHAKRMLGLEKGYSENVFDSHDVMTKLRINKAKHSKALKVINLFCKAFDNLEIELYTEEE